MLEDLEETLAQYSDACGYIIRFNDIEVEDEHFYGHGAKECAIERFRQVADSYTALLYVVIASTVPDQHVKITAGRTDSKNVTNGSENPYYLIELNAENPYRAIYGEAYLSLFTTLVDGKPSAYIGKTKSKVEALRFSRMCDALDFAHLHVQECWLTSVTRHVDVDVDE